MKKILLIVLGCVGLVLGAIGAALPLLPAFPFLMLAAICFARSSERLNNWFINTKLYQNNLQSFVEKKGMTKQVKIKIMTIVSITMLIGFMMMGNTLFGRVALLIVWIFHMYYFIFKIKTPEQIAALKNS